MPPRALTPLLSRRHGVEPGDSDSERRRGSVGGDDHRVHPTSRRRHGTADEGARGGAGGHQRGDSDEGDGTGTARGGGGGGGDMI